MKFGRVDLSKESLAQAMDFSSLNPNVNEAEILECCDTSRRYHFKGFHSNPVWIPLVAHELEGSGIETGCLVSFPFGTNTTEVKVLEAKAGSGLLKGKPWVIDMVTGVWQAQEQRLPLLQKRYRRGGQGGPRRRCRMQSHSRSRTADR